jgi:hypothetical protein
MKNDAAGGIHMRFSDRALWALAVVASVALLMAPAIWNGFPLLQWDTGGYLARWYEGTLVPSRAVVYGLILTAGVPFSFWPVLLLQSGLTVWIAALMLRAHGFGGRPMLLIGIIAALSVGTTLPWLTAILLTDIFCGLGVMALYLLLLRAEVLSHWERIGLIVLIAVAAATHSATLAVLMALQAAAMLLWLIRRDRIPARRLGDGIFALALGALMVFSADYAVAKRLAWTPGGFALSFGRMLQDGIVNKYLDEHCPDRRLKLCAYKDELPRDADKWFWGSPLFNQLGRFDGLGDEMQTIATRALIEYPRLQFETALIATGRQLIDVHTGEGVLGWVMHSYGIIERFTPQLAPAMRAARQQKNEISFKAINNVHYPLALFCMGLLPVLVLLAWRGAIAAEIGELAAVCMLALLANAFVCGALSDPHDRYGARMVWLAGFTLALALSYAVDRRRQPQPRTIPSAEPALS